MPYTRQERLERQELDGGDPNDVVLVKIGHAGTQNCNSYHALTCTKFGDPPTDVPDDATLFELRDMFDWGDLRPKTRESMQRATKKPAKCVLQDGDGKFPCPECSNRAESISGALEHLKTHEQEG